MLRKRIAIDLGTANTLVWLVGTGLVANEPTVVAISAEDSRVVAVGSDAKKMLGRTPETLLASRPMRDGVIADYRVTEAMLRYFVGRAYNPDIIPSSTKRKFKDTEEPIKRKSVSRNRSFSLSPMNTFVRKMNFVRPDVMICVPAGCTQVERRAALDATLSAGASHAYLIDEPLAAAIGAGIPVSAPSGHMILDIGGGSAEAAVISLGGVVISKSVRVAGNKIDESVQNYLKKKHNLIIGDQTAERIKLEIGSALKLKKEKQIEISGRDVVFGLPRSVIVTSSEVTEAIQPTLSQIIGMVKNVLEDTPPELAADIIDKGIVMSGGSSKLKNLDNLLTQETGVPSHVAEDALYSVVRGTAMVMENLDLWKRSVTTKR